MKVVGRLQSRRDRDAHKKMIVFMCVRVWEVEEDVFLYTAGIRSGLNFTEGEEYEKHRFVSHLSCDVNEVKNILTLELL